MLRPVSLNKLGGRGGLLLFSKGKLLEIYQTGGFFISPTSWIKSTAWFLNIVTFLFPEEKEPEEEEEEEMMAIDEVGGDDETKVSTRALDIVPVWFRFLYIEY